MPESDGGLSSGASQKLPDILAEWEAAHSLHYELLANQQFMLEDVHRTAKYHAGIVENASDFRDKVVLDVGAGTGILSLFAAQAGARKVYAVEATSAASYARQLVEHAGMSERIEVVRGRIDEIELDTKVDVVISEPWGFLLVHERMVEVFLRARDRFLKKGGKLFPSRAKLWLAPFRDDELYDWRCEKVSFWERTDFFGVDLSALARAAQTELFAMPVLGVMDPSNVLADPVGNEIDFCQASIADLGAIRLPFNFTMLDAGWLHGLAGWFDVQFLGSNKRVVLSTAPDCPPTHWAQLRFLFSSPLLVEMGQTVSGCVTLRANAQSSYDVSIELDGLAGRRQDFRLQTYFSWQGSG